MWNKAVYVGDEDLAGLEALAQKHAAELAQWRSREQSSPAWHAVLSPTALVIAAVHLLFRGLRVGRDGAGLQVTNATWCRICGVEERQVQKGFAQLRRAGWAFRRRRHVRTGEPWRDSKGRPHVEADIRWASYLSDFGARRLAASFGTRTRVLRSGRSRVVLLVAGVVRNLLGELSEKMRVLAKRIYNGNSEDTPSSDTRPIESYQPRRRQSGVVENTGPPGFHGGGVRSADTFGLRTAFFDLARPPRGWGPQGLTSTPVGSRGRQAGLTEGARFERELDRLWRAGALTPAVAYADLWPTADELGRAWLRREFERYLPFLRGRFLRAAELRARFVRILGFRRAAGLA